ncbi:hypothetical protein LO763_03995 [Glycomyces sp. A-F 0318]|uniref:hypothetical protein n=1 Tax=Glycomyces amatae TaxID=2881355 RepID=UPI001E58783D|nr:hypothetical protein [Glycomyces amatae]MCD0442784.1 hypothetical protein [Glycomyces amatae]
MSMPPPASEPPAAARTRPGTVTTAVWIQILLAVFLIAQSVAGLLYGADAQAAAEDELAAQGHAMSDLPQGTTFESNGIAAYAPIAAAALIIVLALLNGAGNRPSRVVTWVVQPLVLVCGGFITVTQLFAAQFMEAGIEAAGGAEGLDAQALMDAVNGAYPAWTAVASYGVLVLGTLGAVAVIVLLAVPSANAYFRKEEPQTFIPGAPPA